VRKIVDIVDFLDRGCAISDYVEVFVTATAAENVGAEVGLLQGLYACCRVFCAQSGGLEARAALATDQI
jgi:hypothetical protein